MLSLRILRMSFVFVGMGLLLSNCKRDCPGEGSTECDLTDIPYNSTPYIIQKPDSFPIIPIPMDNPQTVEGVELGRMLFYDPILSADSTMSCSSCHLTKGNFTDNLAVSTGIDGIAGTRSSMALLDIAYVTSGLFWDGRSATLEDQALMPVEDPIELHNTWPNAIERIKKTDRYQTGFRKAFGITSCDDITKELSAKAIAQFERILISSGTSKFDTYYNTKDNDVFTDEEFDGFVMYNDLGPELGLPLPDAECFHCHGGVLFTTNEFNNNGLDSAATLNDFPDLGKGMISGNPAQNGMFRIPSLRNIALSAPYMHDGRFETLEEVIDHYSSGGHESPNKDQLVTKLGLPPNPQGLTAYQKQALLAFLHTLTDTTFINRADVQNPFE